MKKEQGLIGVLVAVVVTILFAVPLLLTPLYVFGTQQDREFTVKRLERVNNADSSKYLVFTEDDGVLENTDSFLRWKFNSSDVYNELEEGRRYKCDTYGWRIGFFSQYPNIVSCEEVL